MEFNERTLAGEIGSRLANIRLSRNIKQDTLAKSAGINVRTLRRIEAGSSLDIRQFPASRDGPGTGTITC